jgi:hypothetical protein
MLNIIIICILWGVVQACVALSIPSLYAKITGTYGLISLEPGFFISLIGGAVLALIINPIFLIGVVLGIPCYVIIFRLIAHKPQAQ